MREEIKYFNILSLAYLAALLFVALFLSLIQDHLFFKSDILVLLDFALATAFFLFLISTVPLFFLNFICRGLFRQYSLHILSSIVFAQIIFGFAIHFLDQYVLNTEAVSRFLIICLILFLICFSASFLLCRNFESVKRIIILSKSGFVLSIVFLVYFSISLKIRSETYHSGLPKRNVIIIVLDGLSTKYLNPYNSEEDTSFFSELASQSMVYTNMRSNFAYTAGFFYTLYSGRKNWVEHSWKQTKGLLSILQEAGVNTRWFTFHNSGVPDSHNFPIDFPYKGLRAKFLTSQLAWYPQLLGMDYHIFGLHGTRNRGRRMGYREDALNNLLHHYAGSSYLLPLEVSMIKEIKALRKDSRPFLMVIHLPPNGLALDDTDPQLWEFSENNFIPFGRLNKTKKIINDKYFRYSAQEYWVVKILEQHYKKGVYWGTKSLLNFYKIYRENNWDEDTLLIVTADHGYMFDRQKMAYMFHSDEEVARVPFLLLWKNKIGTDDRMAETIDITQTVLDFFKIEHRFSEEAINLLSNKRKSVTTTLTDLAPARNEYFLNIYNQNDKYVFNIFPGNFKVHKEEFLNYFETVPTENWNTVPQNLDVTFRKALKDYGFKGDPQTAKDILDLIELSSFDLLQN